MGRPLTNCCQGAESAEHTQDQNEDDGLTHVDHHCPENIVGSPSFRLLG